MQDGGDEAAEARLTITSVRSTPPGYTGQRQANLMLKFEPADHPFIVKCGRLVGGGVDKDHLGAWYVPHFMMDGFCFYLATASNGQPLRDFDFWTDALSPVWMEVLLNAMTEANAFSGQPFSRWATEALQSLRGFALGCSERDLNVDSVCTSFDPLPLPSGAPAGAEAASRSRSSSARGSSSSSYARVTRSSAAGPVSGPPAGSDSSPPAASSAAVSAPALRVSAGRRDEINELFAAWQQLRLLDFKTQAGDTDFPFTEA